MILEIKGSSDIGLYFEGLVLDTSLNKDFNFAILQESGKFPNLVFRLYNSLMSFNKTRERSFRKRPERSSIPAALRTFVLLMIFYMLISVVHVK